MTPQDIISDARLILNDTDPEGYRQSTDELLVYVNEGINEVSMLRPELFLNIGDYICLPLQSEQTVDFAEAQVVTRVLSIHGGAALTPFDMDTMDAYNPNWRTDTPGPATQWAKSPDAPLRFFVYPPAPAAEQVLDVQFVANSTTLLVTDVITEVPTSYRSALTDYVVYRASMKDDEHVESSRVSTGYASFVSKVKGG